MRVNDQVTHGGLWWSQDQYYRSKISAGHPNRTFDENAGSDDSIWNMPLLMNNRHTFYTHTALNLPIGATTNPIAKANQDATALGWDPNDHSYLFDATAGALYNWYSNFVIRDLNQ
jgi:hypothetical protein